MSETQLNQEIAVTLSLQEWNVCFQGIAELPFRIAAPVAAKLQRQVSEAAQAAQARGNGQDFQATHQPDMSSYRNYVNKPGNEMPDHVRESRPGGD